MESRTPSFAEIDGASIVDSALDHAAKKAGVAAAHDAVANISRGELDTYLHFRYGLAKEAARQLARMCGGIDAALVFLENRCESYPGDPVLMGLLVSRKTAALKALADSVSEAVRSEIAKRLPAMADFETVLVIEVMDTQEVSERRGLGALVGSLSEPPIQVWPQE